MKNMRKHVTIAGAGISGMTTAICLQKLGYQARIYEKRNVIGGRFKGDLQGLENWTSRQDIIKEIEAAGLDMSLNPPTPLPPLYLLANGKTIYPIASSRPLCYLVKRGPDKDTLDQSLYRQVLNLKIPVYFGTKIKADDADIIATGPNSKKLFAVDLGVKFTTDHEDIAVAVVDNKAAYKGYAYLLISKGYGCLCTVLFDKFHLLRAQFEYAKNSVLKHFPIKMSDVREVGGVGSFATNDHHMNPKIHVGEAGGLQDFLFGFGIRSAIRSGVLAADCWANGLNYNLEAKRQFLSAQKAGLVNRYLFEKVGNFYGGYKWMVRWIRKNQNPGTFMNKAYHFTPIHQILYPFIKRSIKNRYTGIL